PELPLLRRSEPGPAPTGPRDPGPAGAIGVLANGNAGRHGPYEGASIFSLILLITRPMSLGRRLTACATRRLSSLLTPLCPNASKIRSSLAFEGRPLVAVITRETSSGVLPSTAAIAPASIK